MTTDRGTAVRQAREGLKLTRQQLARRSGVATGRLAAIETGHGAPMTDAEEQLLLTSLGEGKAGAPKPKHNDRIVRVVDLTEWCGLQVGDPCRVLGLVGCRFQFRRYVEQANGHVYVEVMGGKGRGSNAVHNFRCVTPDRVLDAKGRRVQELWKSSDPDQVAVAETPTTADVKEEDDDLASAVCS